MSPGLRWLHGFRFHYTLLQSVVTDSGVFVILLWEMKIRALPLLTLQVHGSKSSHPDQNSQDFI